ncbi:lipase maturation factor family protein [Bdellovibrio svalbardensis]|uniref:Lipase maturation factor 2 n=1 Tax=Bdellovibrio svalbardensis TaxID=2972972 RepID=A0ABT6DLM7_9BACT|nr:lipase maturation factor family protein [Bdellovibrio svalbardensis]MDG0817780.1 lipase maturation factor family protein [Bdellovibrio svalbardensis]
MQAVHYEVASWFLSKSLALSYFIAFLSLLPQVLGLYGRQGILSIDHLLYLLDSEMGSERFFHMPSLFWILSSDSAIRFVCFLGMFAASLAFLGFSQSWMFLICWLCYLSFVSCGQNFLSYQWDSLLLEFGFLGLFMAPWRFEWVPFGAHVLNPIILVLCWLLLFKLMLSSGVVKLTHKDASWKNLTALTYHYWTQPLPNPIAYFLHKAPALFQKLSTLVMFSIELIVPVFIFITGTPQAVAAWLLILLQILIILSGNFAFFNVITIGLCLGVIPDPFWKISVSKWIIASAFPTEIALLAFILLVPAAYFWVYKTIFEKSKTLDFLLPYMRFLYPFRISNPYGLFAVMTKNRPELVIEGSNDGLHWQEYEFRFKPASVTKMPSVVAPHQPRLDWQLWFASLESFGENLWLQNLIARMFAESREVQSLLGTDPFGGKSPKFLRILKYEYTFSDLQTLRKKGQWWERRFVEVYSPTFERDEFVA